MADWVDDKGLFKLMKENMTSSTLSDVMCSLGFGAKLLAPEIKLLSSTPTLVGRAMPVQDEDPSPSDAPKRYDAKPYGLMLDSIETLKPDEIYIASGGPIGSARLGDLLIARAKRLGAAGVVLNGFLRTPSEREDIGVPIFARGIYGFGLQERHNVVDFRCPITIGGVRVSPGDLVFGDCGGVCIIPKHAEEVVISTAIKRRYMEIAIRQEIENGKSLFDIFAVQGVIPKARGD